MNNKIFFFLFISAVLLNAQTDKLKIVTESKSDYKIIISSSASRWDSLAALEFQKYIKEISGAILPLENYSSPETDFEIVIGKNNRINEIDTSGIKYDGFIIKTVNNKIYFYGGGKKGTLNAVFSFLEKYLDCRMYSSQVKIIPAKNSIEIPQIDLVDNPAFAYRDVHYYEANQDEYCRWHKLVDSDDKKMWGMFVHTFQTLLPADKYFKDHPEYYSLRNGIRVPQEPCLSNPEVYKIVVDELRKRMAENPNAKYWSVSQNDDDDYCQCDECSRIDSYEGSPSGSVINFVNKIAKEFPDKIISTLAYRYSRKAPLHIKLEKNVNIMLCTIEAYRTKPLADDTSSSAFVKDLDDWSKLTNNIILWDYVVQFSNLISPFPNFQVLQPNIQLFNKYNVNMMFQQGAGGCRLTEFGELRSYLISKLLWNPNLNFDSTMNDFLNGYYGKAGIYIREYIDLMQTELIKSGHKLWIYSNPVEQMKSFLTPELMDRYNSIFDKAELAVGNEPECLERVKFARLPLMYATLEQAKEIRIGEKGLLINMTKTQVIVNPNLNVVLDSFFNLTSRVDNVYVNEKSLTAQKYFQRYKRMLSKLMYNPLGLGKNVKFISEPNWKYPANGEKSLTDGFRGDEDYLFNWVGYEGNDMEVVVDLNKTETIKKVSADFLQNVFSWIFLPEDMQVSISKDGKKFSDVSVVKNITPPTQEELASPIHAFIKNFSCEFEPVKARFIKVKATSMKICPRWHPGYPFKAWIFTDEIVIE
ncbi:MAG: DUF4838 domain-containing protein [Ignavibacteriales bacterium]|nr:MAG: DUF4838 domain-containing protein [Ignavibacteriales bacterium]